MNDRNEIECPSPWELGELALDRVSEMEKKRLFGHFRTCERCRELLVHLASTAEEEISVPAATTAEVERIRSVVLDRVREETARVESGPVAPGPRPRFEFITSIFQRRIPLVPSVVASVAIVLGILGLGEYLRDAREDREWREARSAEALEWNQRAESILTGLSFPATVGGLRIPEPDWSPQPAMRQGAPEEIQEAKHHLRVALRFDPDDPGLVLRLAHLEAATRSGQAAADAYRRVLDLDPKNARARLGLSAALNLIAAGDDDPLRKDALRREALAVIDPLVDGGSWSQMSRYNSVRLLYRLGDSRRAFTRATEYLSREPSTAWADSLRSFLLLDGEFFSEELAAALVGGEPERLELIVASNPTASLEAIDDRLNRVVRIWSEDGSSEDVALLEEASRIERALSRNLGDFGIAGRIDLLRSLDRDERKLYVEAFASLSELVRLRNRGDYEEAYRAAPAVREAFASLGDRWMEALVVRGMGNFAYYAGRYHDALESWTEGRDLGIELGSPGILTDNLEDMGTALAKLGVYAESIRRQEQSLEISRRYSLSRDHGLAELANAYIQADLRREAKRVSLALYERSMVEETRAEQIKALENLAAVRLREGDAAGAVALLESSVRRCEDALARLAGGEWEDPSGTEEDLFEKRLVVAKTDLGVALSQAGELERAQTTLGEALSLAHQTGAIDKTPRILLESTRLLVQTRAFEEALARSEAASDAAQEQGLLGVEWQAAYLGGLAAQGLGRGVESAERFETAYSLLTEFRGRVGGAWERAFYGLTERAFFEEVIERLVNAGAPLEQLALWIERAKGGLPPRDETRFVDSISSRAADFPPGATVLQYFIVKDAVLVLRLDRAEPAWKRLEVPADRIAADAEDLRVEIESRSDTWRASAARLFDRLIRPILPQVADGELCVVPDGFLHRVPFGALIDAENQILVERASVLYSRDLSSMILEGTEPAPSGVGAGRFRAFWPGVTTEDRDGSVLLPALPEARAEASEAARLMKGRVLATSGLSTQKVLEEMTSAKIVHFATHGYQDPFGNDVLYLGGAGSDKVDEFLRRRSPKVLTSRSIAESDLRSVDLVVLSACRSLGGESHPTEGQIGTAWAFQAAGARDVVAALWPLEDKAASEFVRTFYQEFSGERVSPHRVLNRVQREWSTRADSRGHPFYWAPYLIYGSPTW